MNPFLRAYGIIHYETVANLLLCLHPKGVVSHDLTMLFTQEATKQEFLSLNENGKHVLVDASCMREVVDALLYQKSCVPMNVSGGRMAVLCFNVPNGYGILRRYRRGGLIRRFVSDAYVLDNRPLREFNLLKWLFARGLPVPQPLGVCWERRGLLYRGLLATKKLDALDLVSFLGSSATISDQILRKVGGTIRLMHDLGIYHADLNAQNILIGCGNAYLLDFDNAVRAERLSVLKRQSNLLRLRRSMDKHGMSQYFSRILDGYSGEGLYPWLDRIYYWKGTLSDLLTMRRQAR